MRLFELRKYTRKVLFGNKAPKETDDLLGYFKNQDRCLFYAEDLAMKDRDFAERNNKSWVYADDYSNMFKVNKNNNCWYTIFLIEVQLIDEGL